MRRRILIPLILIFLAVTMILAGTAGFAAAASVSVSVTIVPAIEVSGTELASPNINALKQVESDTITFISP